MKKISLIVVLILSGLISFAQVVKDKNVQVRQVDAFHGIEISGGFDVYVSPDAEHALAVSAATIELRDQIVTRVENGILKISLQTQGKVIRKLNQKDLKVYLSAPTLSLIKAGGATDVHLTGKLKGDDLDIHLSGASDINGQIEYNKVDLQLSGASDATISGKVDKLQVIASGASDFKGKDLKVMKCSVSASGASNVVVNVSDLLEPKASGASHIKYYGSPKLQSVSLSGASKVVGEGL
jgi:hypothetical protein